MHYKLDLGIDHLLIDEAQDTSPEQWDIIKRFVARVHGRRRRARRAQALDLRGRRRQAVDLLVPGRGAGGVRREPALLRERASKAAEQEFRPIPFKYSFRSVPAVLEAVDAVFRQPAAHTGLTADPVATVHEAVRAGAPGLVELWPLVAPEERDKVEEWDAPFDTTSETSPRVKLARQIAARRESLARRGDLVGDGATGIRCGPGDILILVRQRGPLFEAIIRALKNADIPVAGADRLMLTEHIAVMDLLALADALLLPEDDLALAAVLKSPLFGLSEDELFDLALDRRASLRAALRARSGRTSARGSTPSPSARATAVAVRVLCRAARRGRRTAGIPGAARMPRRTTRSTSSSISRSAYESRETPSLQGFVAWLRTASAEVKRDMEIARDEVRVMTVHGAKGLEAPIVVLADTTTEPAGPQMLHAQAARSAGAGRRARHARDRIAWMPNRQDETPLTKQARAGHDRGDRERIPPAALCRDDARRRPAGGLRRDSAERKHADGCWYELVQQRPRSDRPADRGGGRVTAKARCSASAGTRRTAAAARWSRRRRGHSRAARLAHAAMCGRAGARCHADAVGLPRTSRKRGGFALRGARPAARARRAAARAPADAIAAGHSARAPRRSRAPLRRARRPRRLSPSRSAKRSPSSC